MVIQWLPIGLGVTILTTGFLLAVIIYYTRKCSNPKHHHTESNNLHTGVLRLHHLNDQEQKQRQNYQIFRRGVSSKPLFSWSDNPSLITDAVENGWSRFAFTTYISSPSTRRSILCGTHDQERDTHVEISWEICQGSDDFMQKIRLNPRLKNTNFSMIKTSLPLPGPILVNSSSFDSFPQESYFEITILRCCSEMDDYEVEGEKIKLIQEGFNAKSNSESLVHVNGNGDFDQEDLKRRGICVIMEDEKCNEGVVMMSVGLTGGGFLPVKLPGGYPGSIGFNSDGSVYLDGIKLVLESDMEEWGRTDKVIGCGYNPSQMNEFFTVDSELVHEFNCKSEEFATPLYPTLASNGDITVVVNFGQSAFKYLPANLYRTPNPCFIGPLANSPTLGYEDSKELFSMGRIDSQWHNQSTTKNSYNNIDTGVEFDDVSEGDLFEIVLDSSRTPKTPL